MLPREGFKGRERSSLPSGTKILKGSGGRGGAGGEAGRQPRLPPASWFSLLAGGTCRSSSCWSMLSRVGRLYGDLGSLVRAVDKPACRLCSPRFQSALQSTELVRPIALGVFSLKVFKQFETRLVRIRFKQLTQLRPDRFKRIRPRAIAARRPRFPVMSRSDFSGAPSR